MSDEEKEMELEALESIFIEDLNGLSRFCDTLSQLLVKTSPTHYELRLVPNPDSDDPEDNRGS